jgi:hypothetical protein
VTARHIDPLRARFAVGTLLLLLAAAAALVFGHVFDSAAEDFSAPAASVASMSMQVVTPATVDDQSEPSQIEGALIAAGCAALALVILTLPIVLRRTSGGARAGYQPADQGGSGQRATRPGRSMQEFSRLGVIRV